MTGSAAVRQGPMALDERTPGHCILPDESRRRVLLVAADGARAEGVAWSLPTVRVNEEWWSPTWLGRIIAQVRRSVGAEVTVLRHVQGAPLWVLELESRSAGWEPRAGARWVTREELDSVRLEPAGLGAVLRAWFAEVAGGGVSPLNPLRPPWERPGWLGGATAWIDEQLGRLGERRSGPVEQVKGAWHLSCVLRVPTSRGAVYFKADRALPPSEPALVAALAARWTDRVPRLAAVDLVRGWMLVPDFGSGPLEADYDGTLAPLGRWEAAARSFAGLQAEASAHVEEWLELGCDDVRGARLARRLEALLEDDGAVGAGEAWGLSADERDAARRAVPGVERLCATLAASGVPDSLVHGDFSGRNVVRTARGLVFYDWAEAAVAHPFFSGTMMAHEVGYPVEERVIGPSGVPGVMAVSGGVRRRLIVDAYLGPWERYAPVGVLREAFEAAARLRPVWRAVRGHRELGWVEPGAPWAVDLARSIPRRVREVCAELGGDWRQSEQLAGLGGG